MAKNPLANAGDTGLIPGLGRFHILWGQLSLSTTTTEPTCCKLPCNWRAVSLLATARESPCAVAKTQCSQIND